MEKLTEEARREKNRYLAEWRQKNKDRRDQHQINYWNKKAKQMAEQDQAVGQ